MPEFRPQGGPEGGHEGRPEGRPDRRREHGRDGRREHRRDGRKGREDRFGKNDHRRKHRGVFKRIFCVISIIAIVGLFVLAIYAIIKLINRKLVRRQRKIWENTQSKAKICDFSAQSHIPVAQPPLPEPVSNNSSAPKFIKKRKERPSNEVVDINMSEYHNVTQTSHNDTGNYPSFEKI